MQIFLPFPDIQKSLSCLDKRRLLKQAVEAKQILNIILQGKNKGGWVNHPAVRMMRDDIDFLGCYYNLCVGKCINDGIKIKSLMYYNGITPDKYYDDDFKKPKWLGREDFHLSHRSNLLRKALNDANGIGASGKPKKKSRELLDRLADNDITVENTPVNLPYVWPV